MHRLPPIIEVVSDQCGNKQEWEHCVKHMHSNEQHVAQQAYSGVRCSAQGKCNFPVCIVYDFWAMFVRLLEEARTPFPSLMTVCSVDRFKDIILVSNTE